MEGNHLSDLDVTHVRTEVAEAIIHGRGHPTHAGGPRGWDHDGEASEINFSKKARCRD